MASYNIEKIKAALEAKANGNKGVNSSNSNGPKLTYWKPTIGEHDIRFLPYQDENAQPFQKVSYYEKLSERRFVAPSTFGMEDPIAELFELRRKDKDKEAWNITKLMKPRDRFYAIIIVRGEEAKGPQVWEMSEETRSSIYRTLAHKDYVDEDMFSPVSGYDFTVTVSAAIENGKPRMFNGFPVKAIDVQPRKKPTKLGTEKQIQEYLSAMPKLYDIFKSQTKTPEQIMPIIEAFIAKHTSAGSDDEPMSSRSATTPTTEATDAKLNDAFGGLDD